MYVRIRVGIHVQFYVLDVSRPYHPVRMIMYNNVLRGARTDSKRESYAVLTERREKKLPE